MEIWLADIPRRVGFRGSFRSKMLNQIVPEPVLAPGEIEHHARRYLRLAKHIGANTDDVGLWGTPLPEQNSDTAFRIGICAGAEYGPALAAGALCGSREPRLCSACIRPLAAIWGSG